MGSIRKQSLYSTVIIIIGFAIGAINQWFFVSNRDYFTPEQYGLTRVFLDITMNFCTVGSLGLAAIMYKFFPYYKDHLSASENDLLGLSLLAGMIGFVLVLIGSWWLQPLVFQLFGKRSPLLVQYYYWIFPFSFFYLFFYILELYTHQLRQTVYTNFLKETLLRFFTTVLILLVVFGWIDFDQFIKLFAFLYGMILVFLVGYLWRIGKLKIVLTPSRVTKKFRKKILILFSYTYFGQIIQTVALTIDSILIATFQGLAFTGVYNFATYAINLSMIPHRALTPISIPHLAQAWKDKQLGEIQRIYERSSINLLAGGLLIILNIWLGIQDAIVWLGMQEYYQTAFELMVVLGIAKLVELGTGVNNYIIATSTHWRFEFYSGVILLALTIPTNYYLVKNYGMIGAAWSAVISLTSYNLIRLWFLWKKFRMQPFTRKTLWLLLIAATSFTLVWILPTTTSPFLNLLIRCGLYSTLLCVGIWWFKITPDVDQLLATLQSRVKKKTRSPNS